MSDLWAPRDLALSPPQPGWKYRGGSRPEFPPGEDAESGLLPQSKGDNGDKWLPGQQPQLSKGNLPVSAIHLQQPSVLHAGTALGQFVGRNDPWACTTLSGCAEGHLLQQGMGLSRSSAPHQLRVKPCRGETWKPRKMKSGDTRSQRKASISKNNLRGPLSPKCHQKPHGVCHPHSPSQLLLLDFKLSLFWSNSEKIPLALPAPPGQIPRNSWQKCSEEFVLVQVGHRSPLYCVTAGPWPWHSIHSPLCSTWMPSLGRVLEFSLGCIHLYTANEHFLVNNQFFTHFGTWPTHGTPSQAAW